MFVCQGENSDLSPQATKGMVQSSYNGEEWPPEAGLSPATQPQGRYLLRGLCVGGVGAGVSGRGG